MRRLAFAIQQLLPSVGSVIGYWLLALSLITLAAVGLKEDGPDTASLWGLSLEHFGGNSHEILQNAYLEMIYHVWTFVTLPSMCFVGMRPLTRSFRKDFVQFLRYGRSSRLFIELSRILALLIVAGVVSLPFVAAVLCGTWYPGLDCHAGLRGLASCSGTILFISVVIYLLAFLNTPAEITVALALVMPFFLTGVSTYLEKVDTSASLRHMIPPGLPYFADETLPSTPWALIDPNVRAGLVLAAGIIVLRLIATARTRWLLADAARAE